MTTVPSYVPVRVGTATDWASVAAGNGNTVAVKTDGTLLTSGNNSVGQLGDGTTSQSFNPAQVGLGHQWVKVAAGSFHTMAVAAT